MNFFPKVNRWLLPENILLESMADMAIDGRNGDEGTCFWLGNRRAGEAEVSHLARLRGNGINKSPMNVRVSPELMHAVHERSESLGLILIGQIHSHSGLCSVDMSASDHAYGISVPFFLSVICPNYAQDTATTLLDCGVHVFMPGRGYVRLLPKEVKRKLILASSVSTSTFTIGENYETRK